MKQEEQFFKFDMKEGHVDEKSDIDVFSYDDWINDHE